MGSRGLLRTGVLGAIVAGLCCGTPLLAVVLGALGLPAWLAYADYVLLPALIIFLVAAGYGAYRLRRGAGEA
jgi:mercuric ion transport protein